MADPGFGARGGARIVIKEGEAVVRGTKCRARGGPPPIRKEN